MEIIDTVPVLMLFRILNVSVFPMKPPAYKVPDILPLFWQFQMMSETLRLV